VAFPIYYRNNKRALWICGIILSQCLLSFIFFLICKTFGYRVVTRQYVFLIPPLFASFSLTIWLIALSIEKYVKGFKAVYFVLAFSVLQILVVTTQLTMDIINNRKVFVEKSAFAKMNIENCPNPLTKVNIPLNEYNSICRELKNEVIEPGMFKFDSWIQKRFSIFETIRKFFRQFIYD